ncbi:MAG: hypothetical protein KGS72_13645 [Cyanobacteria bacterium REEB67]|nr:hypothetical protein [Cyanobacteria bacterium REEB67]
MFSNGDAFRDFQPSQSCAPDRQLDACQRMSDDSYRFGPANASERYFYGAQYQDRNLGYYPEIQPVTVAKDGGSLTIDEFNRVTLMRDAAHRVFQFGYDQKSGDLNAVTNDSGTWTRQKHHGHYTDEWKNQDRQSWKGDVSVTPDGYSFTHENQRVTYTPDGNRRCDYLSDGRPYFSTLTTADGQQKVHDYRIPVDAAASAGAAAGAAVGDTHAPAAGPDVRPTPEAVKGSVHFDVQKGETKAGHLQFGRNDFSIVHKRGGDVYAQVSTLPDAPVTAMQDGLVVYSYNHDPKVAEANRKNGVSVIGLSPVDMKVIDQFKKDNPNQDMVVMQCYDKASKGVRYEVYAGLGLAAVHPGQRIVAGSVIGKSGEGGFEFAARRNAVAGQAIELTF